MIYKHSDPSIEIKEKRNLLVSRIKNKWVVIKRNVEYLLKHINGDRSIHKKIRAEKDLIFSEDDNDLKFYDDIDLNSLHKIIVLTKNLKKCFSSGSAKYNSIFSLIDESISQVRDYLYQKDQLNEYSIYPNPNSTDSIKEIFIDNMRKGVTSPQNENFEKRRQLKRTIEQIEELDSMSQDNLKYVAHSLLIYQEYRLKVENPQDSAKIEKRMFKPSLDLMFVTNALTYPEKTVTETATKP